MKTDGKFTIQSGGITQGIQRELGLSNYECKQLGSIWTQIINEFDDPNNMQVSNNHNDTPDKSNNYLVHKEAIIQFSKECWQRIVNLVNNALHKNIEIEDNANFNEVEPSAELKQNVDKAVSYLTNQLNSLTKEDLQQMGISEAKRDRILEYLKNITYDNSHDSAQAKGGGIVFSIHCQDTNNLANMVTLLMHEANHCDENYLDKYPNESEQRDLRHRNSDGRPIINHRVNTKEEEKACETLGLLTTAVLIKKGVLQGQDNYGRYGNPPHPVTSYLTDKNLLKSDVEKWANSSYTNYPEGISNASITVEHVKDKKLNLPDNIRNQAPLQLQAGDVIKVGDKTYTLGGDNGIVLSPMDSIPFFQMVPHGNVDNELIGRITFDELSPSNEEIDFYDKQNGSDGWIRDILQQNYEPVQVIRNGQVIYTGKKY